MNEKEYSILTDSQLHRWDEKNLPGKSKGDMFEHLSDKQNFPGLSFDYALPQNWLDQFCKKFNLEYYLVLGTTVWVYYKGQEGPVSCCREVQEAIEKELRS